jgi:hypothetical protein
MVAPYNYTLGNIPNPADTFLQGLQQGQAQQQADALRMQQQQQMEAQQRMQAELAEASSDPRKIPGLMVRYPQLAEKLKVGFESMNADEQRGQLQHGAEVASALASGRPDVAIKALRTRAEALRASGDEKGAAAAEASATWAETDPTSLLSSTVVAMNAIPGGDKVSEGILKLFDEKRKAELQPAVVAKAGADATTAQVTAENAPAMAAAKLTKEQTEAAFAGELARLNVQRSRAEIRNINDQIDNRAKRLVLDEQKLSADIAEKLSALQKTKLDPAAKKTVDEAVTASAIAAQAASGMDALATRFETSGAGWGALSAGAEMLKRATGSQDQMSLMRAEYVRLRNSMAIKSLPPGPATDRDIELALRGMPSENASGQAIASFLRGMAKMSRIDAEVSSAKAEWVSEFGGMSAAKAPATVAGIPVQPGMKFEALASQISSKLQEPAEPEKPAPVAEPTATNPKTGERLVLRDGKWVPLK